MRPVIRFLSDELADRIIAEAREVLAKIGVEIHNGAVLSMLAEHGADVDSDTRRARISGEMIDRALVSAPSSVKLCDALGVQTHDLSGNNVHFTPGSAAIHILDHGTTDERPPTSRDYVRYAKLVSRLENLAAQSTALVPSDVHELISDSYRLYLSLMLCSKPVVTGVFTADAFEVMRDLLLAVRGSAEALADKPLAMFSCCATAPLKWNDVMSQSVVDCAKHSIPAELISMPLAGFIAPVTLVGTLVQHAAEILSGVVISQVANPGAPVVYGGSAAIFDVRYETTPMGAAETMMLACGNNEIGKRLGLPTQSYIGLSDAKLLDAQAGLEASMGATLAALSGINSVSGPGMLNLESTQSLEALVLDDEICGMALRVLSGIKPREDFPALPRFEELLRDEHLLISKHTRRYLRDEQRFPSDVIDRANRSRWEEEGRTTLGDRAHAEVGRLLGEYESPALPDSVRSDMTNRMELEARRVGMDSLPHIDT